MSVFADDFLTSLNDKIFDVFKVDSFADDELDLCQKMAITFEKADNFIGKETKKKKWC